jgi:hypothetical protein
MHYSRIHGPSSTHSDAVYCVVLLSNRFGIMRPNHPPSWLVLIGGYIYVLVLNFLGLKDHLAYIVSGLSGSTRNSQHSLTDCNIVAVREATAHFRELLNSGEIYSTCSSLLPSSPTSFQAEGPIFIVQDFPWESSCQGQGC